MFRHLFHSCLAEAWLLCLGVHTGQRFFGPNQAAINMLSAILCGFVQTREATEDVLLGTHQIPKGTRIWINVLSLHLDDKYFPNAKV